MRVGGEVTPDTLAPFGIAVYELSESCAHIMSVPEASMETMYQDILNLGMIFGVSDRAEMLIEGYRAQLAEVTAGVDRANPLRIFIYDSGEDAPFTAGRYAMPTALIEAAGGVNIMADMEKSWAVVGWEVIVERNPEVIVIVNYGDVTSEQKIAFMRENEAFAGIDAVRNNRFVVLEYVEATPGPRNIAAVETLVAGFADIGG
jgi:iron complex transport system substrate-binding protein